MTSVLRALSVICLCLALTIGAGLIFWDAAHSFRPLPSHQRAMAVALMLVGASYAVAHLGGTMPAGERIRAISLGGAFVLWGVTQFIALGRMSVAIDCVLVVVFVVDLSLAVRKRLRRGYD